MASQYDYDTLLKYYKNGKLCKPEIQRGYVWPTKKVAGLIESLYKNYPIGMFLLWEPPNSNHLITLKEQNSLKNPTLAIIDGQQRLTSLYLTKIKQIPVRFNWETEKFALETPKIKSNPKWILVSEIWDDSWNNFVYIQKLKGLSPPKQKEISERLQRVENILKKEPVIHYLQHENYEEITNIFIVLNKSARPIKPDELLFAYGILKYPAVFGPKGLQDLSKKYSNWIMNSKKTGPNKFFIQALSCMSTYQVKLKDPSNKMENYLRTTPETKLLKNFKKMKQGLTFTTQFLDDDLGINEQNNTKLLPSVYPLLLIQSFLINSNFALKENEKLILKFWTFLAMHHGRYSSSSETKLNEDLGTLFQSKSNSIDIIKKWIFEISSAKGGLQVTSLGKALNKSNYFTLFFALELTKAKDWFSGTSIRSIKNIEFHHIFPKKVLEGKYDKSEINDPRNIAIVSEKLNRKIQDQPPLKYFADKKLIQNNIHTQFIPKNNSLLEIKNYKKFLEYRGDLIKKELNNYIKTQEKKFKL